MHVSWWYGRVLSNAKSEFTSAYHVIIVPTLILIRGNFQKNKDVAKKATHEKYVTTQAIHRALVYAKKKKDTTEKDTYVALADGTNEKDVTKKARHMSLDDTNNDSRSKFRTRGNSSNT